VAGESSAKEQKVSETTLTERRKRDAPGWEGEGRLRKGTDEKGKRRVKTLTLAPREEKGR